MRRSSVKDPALFAVGGRYEPIAANFSSCAHFFKCNEATSVSDFTLTDAFGNIVVSSAAATERNNNADGTISFDATIGTIDSGAWIAPGTKKILMLWSGKPASSNANIIIGSTGAASSRGFRSSANSTGTTTPAAVGDGAAAVVVGTAGLGGTGAQLQARALAITWNNATGIAPYDWDGTTWTARAAAGDLTVGPHTGIVTMDAAVAIGPAVRPAFIQIFHLTTLPSDAEIKAALLWTHYYATTSPYNKYIYPGAKLWT